VRGGSREGIVEQILKLSPLWEHCVQLTLTTNMRAQLAGGATEQHANFLLQLGNGQIAQASIHEEFLIRLPEDILLQGEQSLENMVRFVFAGHQDLDPATHNPRFMDPGWLCNRAILCATNNEVDHVNGIVTALFPGEAREFLACDELLEPDEEDHCPPELLSSLKVAGFPPFSLKVKKHMSVMLLRNLDPGAGHVNGARYSVESATNHVIYLRMARDPRVILPCPRINFDTLESDFPFKIRRRQFPIKPAYAITTNKSQGQTLARAGLFLNDDLFSHGQLYVALSRVGNPADLRVLTRVGSRSDMPGQYTKNVVWPLCPISPDVSGV
jgi:hypothetical protein